MTPKKLRKGKEEKIARKLSYVTIASRSLFERGTKKTFFLSPRFLDPSRVCMEAGGGGSCFRKKSFLLNSTVSRRFFLLRGMKTRPPDQKSGGRGGEERCQKSFGARCCCRGPYQSLVLSLCPCSRRLLLFFSPSAAPLPPSTSPGLNAK